MRRSGQYYVRVRVPNDLKARVGLVEVRRSLGPMHFQQARLLAVQIGTRLRECFMMLRNAEDLSKGEIRQMIRDCYTGLEKEADRPYQPQTTTLAEELFEQREMSQEFIGNAEGQIAAKEFGPELRATTARLAAERGIDISTASPDRLREICEGVARALVEQQRLFQVRLDDSLTEYAPTDPLFASSMRGEDRPVGLIMTELVEEYLRAKKGEWTAKTLRTHEPKLKLLVDFVGNERRAETVTTQELWAFRDGLLRLRRNYHTSVGRSFQSRQTSSEEGRITAATAANILARTKAMFRWAHERAYIPTNPAAIVSVDAPKQKKGKRSRRPFTASELAHLFGSTVFTGCKSRSRRFEPGSDIIKDARFWLPILGYHTGARLGELVQLHFDDCVVDGPTPHISINENSDAKPGEDSYKHVKSEAGVRIIPLHPDLIELGFPDYVKRQRKKAGTRKRLFFGVKFGADDQPSTVFSKWFGRCLDKVGLTDPALCFHSFRHTAEDYFRSSQVPKYLIDQIIGHQDHSAAAEYGAGVSLEVAYDIVASLKLPVRLPQLIKKIEGDAT